MSKPREYQPQERVPGTVYQVVRMLAQGGMGTVYDVEDTTIGKRYVLKTLHPDLASRSDLARRMQAEARTLARLNHPNIVEVVTAGVTTDNQNLPFYVMEKLNGQNLREVLEKKGALDLPHAYHIAIDLLDALDHAHEKGIIHRDVKPENVFLHRTATGVTVTKLLDFGVMTLLDGGRGETAGRFVGTLRYAAPEQLKSEPPTPRMDLYAAALVLYELVTGRGPFDDERDDKEIAGARLKRPAPPLSRFISAPRELELLMRAALDKAPDQRPRDAYSFGQSLRNLKRASGFIGTSTDNKTNGALVISGLGDTGNSPRPPSVRPSAPNTQPNASALRQSSPAPPPVSAVSNVPAVSPVVADFSSTSVIPPALDAKDTVRAMSPPTVMGRTIETPPPSMQFTARMPNAPALPGAGGIDREALTRSMALDTPRMPKNDTSPLGMLSGLPNTPPPPADPYAFQLGDERPPEPSVEAHTRTLQPVITTAPKPNGSRVAAIVISAIVVMSVAGVATGILMKQRGKKDEAAPPTTSTEIKTASPSEMAAAAPNKESGVATATATAPKAADTATSASSAQPAKAPTSRPPLPGRPAPGAPAPQPQPQPQVVATAKPPPPGLDF